MSIEANKAILRRWYDEFWHAGKLDVVAELLQPDYVFGEGYGAGAPSVEGVKEAHRFWRGVLPNLRFTIDDMVAEGDTVVVCWTGLGTHQGDWEMELGTVPASGKVITTSGTTSFYLRAGKIIRDRSNIDFVSMLQQLGAHIQASPPQGS
jgi:predicted ester cyclase